MKPDVQVRSKNDAKRRFCQKNDGYEDFCDGTITNICSNNVEHWPDPTGGGCAYTELRGFLIRRSRNWFFWLKKVDKTGFSG